MKSKSILRMLFSKMQKGMLSFAGAATISATILGAAATDTIAADVTLRLHQFLPPQASVPKNILIPWIRKIEKESGGKIKIQHFPAMQLGGKPPELYDQVVDGVADIIWTLPGYSPGRFPRTEVFELPFIMTNAEAVSRAYWQLGEETMLDNDFKQVKVLGLWVHGPGAIHSKKPIKSVKDLNGVKLRAPSRITNAFFKNLGASPIGMPVPAVPEAISKGVLDAAILPWEVTTALKTSELVENHTMFGKDALYTATFLLAMNKDRYLSLPEDLRKVIDNNSGLEFSAYAGKLMEGADEKPRQAAAKRGNNLITLTPDEVAEWKDAANLTIKDWVADMDKKDLDGTGLLERATRLIAENTK